MSDSMNNESFPTPGSERRSIWLSPEYRSTSDEWIARGVPFLTAFLVFRYGYLDDLPFIQETPPALAVLQIPCLIGVAMAVVMIGLTVRDHRNTLTVEAHIEEGGHREGQREESEPTIQQRVPVWAGLHSLLWPRFHKGMLLWVAGTAGNFIIGGEAITAVIAGIVVAVMFVLLDNLNEIRRLF